MHKMPNCLLFLSCLIPGCAGGGAGGGGGACQLDACATNSSYSFDQDSSSAAWKIKVTQSGGPYRAFAYMPLCSNYPSCLQGVFDFGFKFKIDRFSSFNFSGNYMKLLFWGDGNNIMWVFFFLRVIPSCVIHTVLCCLSEDLRQTKCSCSLGEAGSPISPRRESLSTKCATAPGTM